MTRTIPISLPMFAVALLALANVAKADAIMGPPDDCAPGAIGRSSHAGQWCTPTTCSADADCAATGIREALFGGGDHTYVCRAVDLCVRSETYSLGGMRPAGEAPSTGTRDIASACAPTCTAPAACTHEKRCVLASLFPPPAPPTPPVATPPVAAPSTSAPPTSTAPPPVGASAPSSGMCAVSARGAVGPALVVLVVLGALALTALRRARRSSGRRPPR